MGERCTAAGGGAACTDRVQTVLEVEDSVDFGGLLSISVITTWVPVQNTFAEV